LRFAFANRAFESIYRNIHLWLSSEAARD
jgi:hypothetical protein